MMNSESFRWQSTSKVCNGLYDFGLLRDKPHENKPKVFSVYFSKTVLIIGVLAIVTFAICLILADKYQKSVHVPHHYASFVYQRERGKFYSSDNGDTPDNYNIRNNTSKTQLENATFKKIQNISSKIQINEINDLLPITTVLRSVNATSRQSRKLSDMRNVMNQRTEDKRNKNVFLRKPQNLADILKRTELKPIKVDKYKQEVTTTTEESMQFAQLEIYKNYYKTKNLQELLKYINCNKATDCAPPLKFNYNIDGIANSNIDEFQVGNARKHGENNEEQTQVIIEPKKQNLSTSTEKSFKNDDLLYSSDTSSPMYYYSYLENQKQRRLDPFYRFRASSPMEINDLDESESSNHAFYRFSNRIYGKDADRASSEIYTQALDPFLKPPTPQPTTLSFTPSYTNAIFHGFNEINSQENEPKAEASDDAQVAQVAQVAQMKPVSLMVEIFPANDYELPGSLFDGVQNVRKEEPTFNSQANNPPWLPWRLFPYAQNKMRLFVNLFPQHSSA